MRLVSFSDDDRVLSGERAPAVPLSVLENRREDSRERHPSASWLSFAVIDPDQRELERQVEFLEDAITDIEDRLGQLDKTDSQRGFRTVDAIDRCASRLSAVAEELRRRL